MCDSGVYDRNGQRIFPPKPQPATGGHPVSVRSSLRRIPERERQARDEGYFAPSQMQRDLMRWFQSRQG